MAQSSENHNSNKVLLTKKFYQEKRLKDKTSIPAVEMANHVGWNSTASQAANYYAATYFPDINWQNVDSVLDIGCGYGHLIGYLRNTRGFKGNYTGIDIISEFISSARACYGQDHRNLFVEDDFLNYNWKGRKFEIVVAIGVLGVNYDHPDKHGALSDVYAEEIIQLMSELAIVAMSTYFTNNDNANIDKKTHDLAYYQCSYIEHLIKMACGIRCRNLVIDAFPNVDSTKTIARALLTQC